MHQDSATLFIPDISGFSRFIDETEISHSQHIVTELLEALIDANELDLVVSEVEGDAVFFSSNVSSKKPWPDRASLCKRVPVVVVFADFAAPFAMVPGSFPCRDVVPTLVDM